MSTEWTTTYTSTPRSSLTTRVSRNTHKLGATRTASTNSRLHRARLSKSRQTLHASPSSRCAAAAASPAPAAASQTKAAANESRPEGRQACTAGKSRRCQRGLDMRMRQQQQKQQQTRKRLAGGKSAHGPKDGGSVNQLKPRKEHTRWHASPESTPIPRRQRPCPKRARARGNEEIVVTAQDARTISEERMAACSTLTPDLRSTAAASNPSSSDRNLGGKQQ